MSGDMPPLTPEFLWNTPAGRPPPGVPYNYADIKANFVNPESIAPTARAVISIFLGLMIIVLALRLYSRFIVIRKTGFDDWVALVAGVSSDPFVPMHRATWLTVRRLLALLSRELPSIFSERGGLDLTLGMCHWPSSSRRDGTG